MKLPKIRELREAIKALIKGPYTSKFPEEPHKPHPNFRGQPTFNEDKCVGCCACEEVCPVYAIAHEDKIGGSKEAKRTMIHYTDTCIFCGQCEAACISDHEGIKQSNDWELSFFDRKESQETIDKELQLCEICGTVIACKDHLKWISAKIGELTYSNPTLYLSRLKSLGITDENTISALSVFSSLMERPEAVPLEKEDQLLTSSVPLLKEKSIKDHGRSDRVKILCARCRRETTLTTK